MTKIEELVPQFVEFMPSKLEEGILYISEKYETAIHLCPCGCGHQTVTPIKSWGWNYIRNDKVITLEPSISNYQLPCKSHYWIRENKIVWA